ncbi:uncharacterized protein J3D65DRAFT_549403 [Phyllosticta citribraziliensis]|uniref:Tr-type G domain-containing protein n=1 Tax=Phyllosticta citribraziliensis TaxID=989973 RepID=A0ABR1LZB0_9PEZI
MASIFTFDPDPPRVASPWSTPRSTTPQKPTSSAGTAATLTSNNAFATSGLTPRAVLETDSSVTKLDAEPQEGPTEYKLHLLLRPRRSFNFTSTARHVAGSHRTALGIPTTRTVSESGGSHTPPKQTSSQSRQHRLEQLTTQLLWRLQQSSPYHSTSANELVVPQLPEATPQLKSQPLAKVLPGLEESQGALYEIGVADDGTFVGLAEDEMEESLTNLRAMAASLGCSVKVLRMIPVGDCTWSDDVDQNSRSGPLWVAEAFVRPEVAGSGTPSPTAQLDPVVESLHQMDLEDSKQASAQLRLSLTGATMSGKSSLLGSLSTATLDNGRGKSRLSLLKHRHEIASGMTSSVTQELIGYNVDDESGEIHVVNYASGNIDSWTDIHSACQAGRLVFLSDSAGHPRYRRTAVRGLMGWAPHWTLLCMPADNDEDTSGKIGSTPSTEEMLGSAVADVDLSEAHLELCLNLKLPLIVVFTKLDLASKAGMVRTMSKLLSALKRAGRTPRIISDIGTLITEDDLHIVPASDVQIARGIADELALDPLGTVPIVLTSAVKGNGIRKLHALLNEIQIPQPLDYPRAGETASRSGSSRITALYHIEDIYKLNLSGAAGDSPGASIISGHLRHGVLHLGDELLLGPFPTGNVADDSDSSSSSPKPSDQLTASRSFPGALHRHLDLASRLDPTTQASSLTRTMKQQEWRRVRITSIRNLRLPVRTLHAGQVGTLGILPLSPNPTVAPTTTSPAVAHHARIRKGMVLVLGPANPPSHRSFVARFATAAVRNLIVGSLVVTYIASVRASAKVVAIAIDDDDESERTARSIRHDDNNDDAFGFFGAGDDDDDDDDDSNVDDLSESEATLVTFQFVATREFLEPGAQVLIMEGGGGRTQASGSAASAARMRRGLVGLEGFVGRVVQGFG